MKTIVLASSSPRRKTLLENIGLKFIVNPSNYKEIIGENLSSKKYAERLSFEKAMLVAPRYKDALIIAADTLVILNNKVIGKPKTKLEAKKMLKSLSGKMHFVITGFTIYDTKAGKCVTKSEKSKVYFRKIKESEIDSYVATGNPFDKAGGYAIQEKAGIFLRKVEGDFFNVVGLPIYSLVENLKKFGVGLF